MSDADATLIETLHTAGPDDAPARASASGLEMSGGWARRLLERQLWVLGQLAEGGLEIARSIERQATQPQAEPAREAVRGDLPLAYARVSRAVRLTILLQSKLIGELQTLERMAAHTAHCAKISADSARPGLQRQMKVRVQRIVGRIAQAEGDDAEDVERLMRETAERLDQDEIYGDVLTRPVSELIARLCADLDLAPDWPALAEEAWARDEMASGAVGRPLAGRCPPLPSGERLGEGSLQPPPTPDPADTPLTLPSPRRGEGNGP